MGAEWVPDRILGPDFDTHTVHRNYVLRTDKDTVNKSAQFSFS